MQSSFFFSFYQISLALQPTADNTVSSQCSRSLCLSSGFIWSHCRAGHVCVYRQIKLQVLSPSLHGLPLSLCALFTSLFSYILPSFFSFSSLFWFPFHRFTPHHLLLFSHSISPLVSSRLVITAWF